MNELDARALLAARLTCWHRLTGPESDELVALFLEQARPAQDYAAKNPLGGPARIFEAMAAAIRAGDSYESVLGAYGFAEVGAAQGPTLQEQLDDALGSLDFYKRRVEALQQWQSKMQDPERTIVCDIIANGQTLEPAGDRYAPPAPLPAKPVQRPVAYIPKNALEHFCAPSPSLILRNVPIYGYDAVGTVAVYTEPPAPQPAQLAVPLTHEQSIALREGHQIGASDGYFAARPEIYSHDRIKVFEDGFKRGWETAQCVTDPLADTGKPMVGAA